MSSDRSKPGSPGNTALPRALPRGGTARRWGRTAAERLLADGLIVAAVLGWWALSLGLPDYIMPHPLAVAATVVELFIEPEFLAHTATSLARVAGSVVIAVALGSALALLPRWLPVLDAVVHGRVKPLLNSFPSVGWAILAVIWFDVSNFSVMFVEVAILTPFCLINVSEGLRELDRELLEMARSFTRARRRVFVRVTVPLLMPYVMAAVRIAYGVGWKIALVAELFGATSGLGYLMLKAQTVADAAMVFATCFAIVLIFFAGEKLVIDPLSRMIPHRGTSN